MIELRLDAADVAATRFARSRLGEVVASLQLRRRPERVTLAPEWTAWMAATRTGADARVLDALVSERLWLPDFISPFPAGPEPSLEEELAVIRRTPPAVVADDFAHAYHDEPLPPAVARALRDPARFRDLIADALGAYWETALAPLWPRMVALYEADVAYRMGVLANEGLGALLLDLGDAVLGWEEGRLLLDVGRDLNLVIDVAGRRLPLIPSVFTRRLLLNISAELPPSMTYGVRGRGGEVALPGPPDALSAVVGRGRAAVLAALDVPRAPTDLAALLGVTAPGVSQHLGALSRAGLVRGTRTGRRVRYALTDAGRTLLTAAGDTKGV